MDATSEQWGNNRCLIRVSSRVPGDRSTFTLKLKGRDAFSDLNVPLTKAFSSGKILSLEVFIVFFQQLPMCNSTSASRL